MPTDLLLLNATNLPWRPIFPYAFVQVAAVARRAGLTVASIDLLDIPRERWRSFLAPHLAAHQPRMVGLHIRQGDSVFLDDYYASPAGPQTTRTYFPIDENRHLVDVLRSLTDVPIIAGGFGFTTHARRLFEHLQLDYGVQGDPDDMFEQFDVLAARRDARGVRGLLHRVDGVTAANPRGYFAPAADLEYTDPVFDQLVRFYGHAQVFGRNPPTVAVEVMRGCPFSCFFCTEPYVKGPSMRYRDLDVVEAELEQLVRRQIWRFWLVCSELDLQGVKFGLALAERIIRIQEKHGGPPIEWSAYALPRLSVDELRLLQRAGYAGALNDVLSLEDANLRAARVPYRSKQAVAFLKAVTQLDREEAVQSAANAAAAEGKVTSGLTQRTPKELASILGLFLGNAHATVTTIPTTLRRIADEGLRENYRAALAFPSTRVFAPDGEPICETTPRGLRTYGPGGAELAHDFLQPTFYYPDFLIERLGTPAAIIDFLRYVGETFMSIGHRGRKDWAWFLSNHVALEELVALLASSPPLDGPAEARALAAAPEVATLLPIYSPAPPRKAAANAIAHALIAHVIASQPAAVARVDAALGFEAGSPPRDEYRLTEHLYARYGDRAALVAAVAPATPAERLYLDWLLYANNVILRPEYRELLFAPVG